MERPTTADPKADWADFVREVVGLDPDGHTKAELIALTEPEPAAVTADGTAVEVFSGPAFDLHLAQTPVPDSVTVRDGDRVVPTHVTGSTVRRVGGHFGRGPNRWHVTYTPA